MRSSIAWCTTVTGSYSKVSPCADTKPSAESLSTRLNQKNIDRDQVLNDSLMTASRPARHHPECWTGFSRNGGPPSSEYAGHRPGRFERSRKRKNGAPGRNRTGDLALRRHSLYPLSYRGLRLEAGVRLRPRKLVEEKGIEPSTFALRTRRSPN